MDEDHVAQLIANLILAVHWDGTLAGAEKAERWAISHLEGENEIRSSSFLVRSGV
jgi:hypothetical protein